jgi:oligoribonuclease
MRDRATGSGNTADDALMVDQGFVLTPGVCCPIVQPPTIPGVIVLGSHLIWIDLEMTGLDPDQAVILEIASVVTDSALEIVAEGPNIAINHPESTLLAMEAWSRSHHEASGLLERVKSTSCDDRKAEQETLGFLSHHCKPKESPLCGNSVWQDRRFLIKYMPTLEAFLHYRNIDVSSIKELVKRWYPSFPSYEKKKAHRALSDIKESIKELKYYRDKIFVPTSSSEY